MFRPAFSRSTSPTPPSPPNSHPPQASEQLSTTIDNLLGSLLELGICTSDGEPLGISPSPGLMGLGGLGGGGGAGGGGMMMGGGGMGGFGSAGRGRGRGRGRGAGGNLAQHQQQQQEQLEGAAGRGQGGAGLVPRKVNEVVSHLEKMARLSKDPSLQLTPIPRDVLTHLDNIKNPHLFTRDVIERVASENQYTYGIMETIREYQSHLGPLLSSHFPEIAPLIQAHSDPSTFQTTSSSSPPTSSKSSSSSTTSNPTVQKETENEQGLTSSKKGEEDVEASMNGSINTSGNSNGVDPRTISMGRRRSEGVGHGDGDGDDAKESGDNDDSLRNGDDYYNSGDTGEVTVMEEDNNDGEEDIDGEPMIEMDVVA